MIQLSSNQVKFCICSCSIFPCYLWPDLNFKLSSFCILILTVTLLLLVDWISNSRAIIFFIKQSKHFLFNKILHLYHLMFDSKRKKRTLTFPIFYALVIPTDLRKRPSNINKDRISLSPLHELVTSFFWFGLKTYDSLLYNNNHFQFYYLSHYQCLNGQVNFFSSKYFREKINYELMQRTFFMTVLSVIHVFFFFYFEKAVFSLQLFLKSSVLLTASLLEIHWHYKINQKKNINTTCFCI
jgi:hypothetical protein